MVVDDPGAALSVTTFTSFTRLFFKRALLAAPITEAVSPLVAEAGSKKGTSEFSFIMGMKPYAEAITGIIIGAWGVKGESGIRNSAAEGLSCFGFAAESCGDDIGVDAS